jgi:hypothetical protein
VSESCVLINVPFSHRYTCRACESEIDNGVGSTFSHGFRCRVKVKVKLTCDKGVGSLGFHMDSV